MKTNICEHNNFLNPDFRWKTTSVNTIFSDLKPKFSCKATSVNVYCVHRLLCTPIFPLYTIPSSEDFGFIKTQHQSLLCWLHFTIHIPFPSWEDFTLLSILHQSLPSKALTEWLQMAGLPCSSLYNRTLHYVVWCYEGQNTFRLKLLPTKHIVHCSHDCLLDFK